MLALRYLNPLRNLFSIITLICLMGVALGVMVLIVVLSVMEGLQQQMEDRVLAFTPHYTLSACNAYGERVTLRDELAPWEEIVTKLQQVPGVVSAYPQLENESFVQTNKSRKTCRFHAIQPHNQAQLAQLTALLREGSFDFGEGLNEECVISAPVANALQLAVGDMLHLTPVGSLDEVASVYTLIQNPLQTHENKSFLEDIQSLFTDEAAGITDLEKLQRINSAILSFDESKMRKSEINACRKLYQLGHLYADGKAFHAKDLATWQETANTLVSLDRDKEDGKAVKDINELVMPVDLQIIGIYQTPENMPSPDIYVPLAIAQDIMGFSMNGSNQIQGIGIRLEEAHQTEAIREMLVNTLPSEAAMNEKASGPDNYTYWQLTPWTTSLDRWFQLIANERTMMSFVLSVISLISAFCIMAVMFTISMQRRREIAVMQALGATPWTIMRIFVWQGLIIGFVGALMGIGLALLVLHYRIEIQMMLSTFGMDPFPMEAHGISLPAAYNPETFIRQAISAFVMVTIAAVVPAFFVSRQDPSKALRSN